MRDSRNLDDTQPNFFCRQAFDFLPSDHTVLSEIDSVFSHKVVVDETIRANQLRWSAEVERVVEEFERRVAADGWVRVKFEPSWDYNPREFELDMLPAFLRTGAKRSSAGLWPRFLNKQGAKKCDILDAYLSGDLEISQFFKKVHEVWRWLHTEGNHNFPIHAYPKHEPIPYDKLYEGKHRVILMPDWAISIIEKRLSQYHHPERDEIAFLDDLMAYYRPGGPSAEGVGPKHYGSMVGCDVAKELPYLQSFFDLSKTFDYDVSKWDKSLPKVVTSAYYRKYYGYASDSKELCDNIAVGITGKGSVITPIGLVNFGEVSNWCSGADKTLAGNDHIHEGLCNAAGFGCRVLMGDDANVEFGGTEEELGQLLLSYGLKAKRVQKVSSLQFCKVTVVDGHGKIDIASIEKKMRARHGDNADVYLDVLKQVAKSKGYD